jgi:hypothetical protein
MITALVVGNDALVRRAARQALEHAGFIVREAADGIAAPALIIVQDDDLGVMALGRRYPQAAIIRLGGNGGLSLPFDRSELLAAARLGLAQRRARPRAATKGSRRRSTRRQSPPA